MSENKRVRQKIHSSIEPLMLPHLSKVDDALDPGLTFLSWTSINIDQFIENAHKALGKSKLLFHLLVVNISAILSTSKRV